MPSGSFTIKLSQWPKARHSDSHSHSHSGQSQGSLHELTMSQYSLRESMIRNPTISEGIKKALRSSHLLDILHLFYSDVYFKMAPSLGIGDLFGVQGLVAVVTGGGSGMSPL